MSYTNQEGDVMVDFDGSIAEVTVPSVSPAEIVAAARDLFADGGDPEYGRALVNLVSDLLGFTQDDYNGVAAMVGVK